MRFKYIFIIIVVLLFISIVVGWVMGSISNDMCREECVAKGTTFFERIPSGNFKLDDMCVCYLESGQIETVRLGE